jgi:serine/threonine protein kinase
MGCSSSKDNVGNDDEWCDAQLLERTYEPQMLNRTDYKLDKFIQQGGMGIVYSGTNPAQEKIACKLFGYNNQKPDDDSIRREINLLLALQGIEGVVKMHGIFMDSEKGVVKGKHYPFEYPAIVMEYLGGGDFYAIINSSESVSEKDIGTIFRKIIIALGEIHKRGYVHRDLKPENIMLLSHHYDSPVRLIDCGFMVLLPTKRAVYRGAKIIGSPGYLAPESILEKEYSVKSDIWQVGCCLYSMLSGYHAFDPDGELEDIVDGLYYEMKGDGWDQISLDAKQLVQAILVTDPDKRPSIEEILAHPWLSERASTKGLGGMYLARIKQLSLRQKMRKFFFENDQERMDTRRRELMKVFLPFQHGYSGHSNQERIKEFDRRLMKFQTLVVKQMRSGRLVGYEMPHKGNVAGLMDEGDTHKDGNESESSGNCQRYPY